jgi:hypothetical protein
VLAVTFSGGFESYRRLAMSELVHLARKISAEYRAAQKKVERLL